MLLAKWLRDNEVTVMEFGKRVGVSVETVRDWAYGRSTPQIRHMLKVKKLTKGDVDETSFPPTHSRRKRQEVQ
jgi:hypothetical protein